MHLLDLTLGSAVRDVALDEALLEDAEHAAEPVEWLRIWEPARTCVVIGRGSLVDAEVHLNACLRNDIPVLRRASGGAAIVTGPGCLMYALVLSLELRPDLKSVDVAHRVILEKFRNALKQFSAGVQQCGTSDLAIDERKFSGNSLRMKRRYLLYHGTLLYNFALSHIANYLRSPPKQPEYRNGRSHEQFLCNVPATRLQLTDALGAAWHATQASRPWPADRLERLVNRKYASTNWNLLPLAAET